eukprot:12890779-Prorocentrum_lima.AAC.1
MRIEPCLCSVASALFHSDQHSRRAFEHTLVESGAVLALHVNISRYDATPMPVTQTQIIDQSTLSAGVPSGNGSVGDSDLPHQSCLQSQDAGY